MDTMNQNQQMSQGGPGMQTIYCSYCSVQLSFPRGSMYIQCPKCQATQNPHAPQQTVCIGCGTLLAHPSNSLYIQCPKCLITMNARENRANVNVPGGQGSNSQYPYQNDQSQAFNNKPPKKKKDPNAPKAASNAYMIFCKERRAKLKKENPELAFGKIGAKLGEIWRNLSADEKRPYEERAAADRERYRKEMESYRNDSESGGAAGTSSSTNGAAPQPSVSKKRSYEESEPADGNAAASPEHIDKKPKIEEEPSNDPLASPPVVPSEEPAVEPVLNTTTQETTDPDDSSFSPAPVSASPPHELNVSSLPLLEDPGLVETSPSAADV